MPARILAPLALGFALAVSLPATAGVAFDWVTVGDPGNACDAQFSICRGAVDVPYRISKFETTNAQYAAFLNAVAVSDPNGLYNPAMGTHEEGGILRTGSDGAYAYTVKVDRADTPVNFVSYWDALRFANWLHNDQPSGPQGAGTTETGAYEITEEGIANDTITRDGGARFFLTNEDEWYKAAYYDPAQDLYRDYPTGAHTLPTCNDGTGGPNEANCDGPERGVTDVGTYTGSPSPNGTFDQGGNVWEWLEEHQTVFPTPNKASRGGSYGEAAPALYRGSSSGGDPTIEPDTFGFRMASPAPPVPVTGVGGSAVLSIVLALIARRRLRA